MTGLTKDHLWQESAADLAAALRAREVSSEAVVRAHLDRIADVNPDVNAVTVVLEEEALAAARRADAALAAGEAVGPLHGLPITVKENFDVVGSATTCGVVALRDSRPEEDAPVIAQLKRAGAIPLGRTNMPDFGLRFHSDNDLHGATRNPWDPARTAGGSSGGEAAALACGLSPLGIGGDMGGSLRYPAQCCGIAAIKPSRGRVSRIMTRIFPDPPLFYEQVAAVSGPMARHVKDLRLALEVMSQPDPEDPGWVPAPWLGTELPRPVRVAVTTDPLGEGVAPAVTAGIRKAGELLAAAGYVVEEIDPPAIEEAGLCLECIANAETESYLATMRPMMSSGGQRVLDGIMAAGGPAADLDAYRAALGARYRIAQDWSRFLVRTPLVLGPVSTQEPFAVGADLEGPEAVRDFLRSIRLTEVCNLLGLPSLVLPVGVAEGLPQAAQLMAPRFHEALLFEAAEIVEREVGVITPIDPRGTLRRKN